MKDVNLNKTTDPDTPNASTEVSNKEDINKNQTGSIGEMSETPVGPETECANGNNETDNIPAADAGDPAEEAAPAGESAEEAAPAAQGFQSKYKYSEDQWSPMNESGKKYYDVSLLKQIKEDPECKKKPDSAVSKLEACKIMRSSPLEDPLPFTMISRPINDSLMPSFAKSSSMSRNTPRDQRKDGRNTSASSKGSVKLAQSPKPVIRVSLSLREEVKLNENENAWKPTNRIRTDNLTDEAKHEVKTEELYKKFRGILNKLTPQKFDTLMERVKTLEIDTQKRLEGVINLVFEKAIEEPNFSEAYAHMCKRLSMLKVPAENATSPDQFVNFRALIITRCQKQFVTENTDEVVLKLEKELAESTDPVKRKELQIELGEENRRIRMRSVGNVRFIGELYKLKMLTAKIMVFCMNHLVEKLEEEKLECLCKLLTTIGEQVENEVKEPLDAVFKKMQDIVEKKTNKISSRVRFMLQDVIELRRRKWVGKSVKDAGPKTMDQIQKEAEQQQRHIELMNAIPSGGGGGGGRRGEDRRDDRKRGDRGDGRRGGNSSMDGNNWKTTSTRINYSVDTNKLRQAGNKNLSNIKLAPQMPSWNFGAGAKTPQSASKSVIGLPTTTTNMYSLLSDVQADPISIMASKDITPSKQHAKGASIERSMFAPPVTKSDSVEAPLPRPAATPVSQTPLPDALKKQAKSTIDQYLFNKDDAELVADVKQLFELHHHAGLVAEIFNVALEKSIKDTVPIAKALLHLVNTKIIAPDNVVSGLKEILEFGPDLYIDIPMLYDSLGKIVAPQIENKHVTFAQIHSISDAVISAGHGPFLLKAIVRELRDSMGPNFVKNKWTESALQIKQWMADDQVSKFVADNKCEFLEGGAPGAADPTPPPSPAVTTDKLLTLINADENFDCIKGWVHDNLGPASSEDWFVRSLIQAVCEHSIVGVPPHLDQNKISKYIGLLTHFGHNKQAMEINCLIGIQQLIHRLEHPQGLSLEIFQFLHEQDIISIDGFLAWENSEIELEGKGVMIRGLTSFFTDIKEADNDDSGSED